MDSHVHSWSIPYCFSKPSFQLKPCLLVPFNFVVVVILGFSVISFSQEETCHFSGLCNSLREKNPNYAELSSCSLTINYKHFSSTRMRDISLMS